MEPVACMGVHSMAPELALETTGDNAQLEKKLSRNLLAIIENNVLLSKKVVNSFHF